MVDHHFADAGLAALYDVLHPWAARDDFRFYLPLVMAADAVLDVGCGTGLLLRRARAQGHTGRLCGLDPAGAMLDVARARRDVEWVVGDLAQVAWEHAFDLVVMTGHAFQVLLTDDEVRAALAAVRRALTDDGRFAFETRNPPARAWERWTPAHAVETTDGSGAVVRMVHDVETPVESELVRFTTTYTRTGWDLPRVSRSTLRFLDADALAAFLHGAGLRIEAQYGNWDGGPLTGASPEIVTIAHRA